MMEIKVIDLNQVIKRIEKILRRIIGEDIELKIFLTEGLGRIKADPAQLEQVIINLAVNARDAMPEGGKLTIETSNVKLDEDYAKKHMGVKPGPYVMMSISDTGTGMSPEIKEKIFEPFFTTKEMGRGTGLGLSTSYGIIKQSDGNIWVYSEPGKGTTFKIYLPRVDEPIDKLKEEPVFESLKGSETILVVEDDEVVRNLATRILKKQGYKVLEAPNGGSALIMCEDFKETINLIITDVVMPGMSGRNLVDRLREIHPEMKVLFMSGYTDNVIVHHGILEKEIDFIQKPFTIENLSKKVREILERPK
jgi:CheY-like chemotaxis protein